MIAKPYHTALSWGREQSSSPAERFESDDSVAFVHDLLSGPLPPLYDRCDVFYCEPPWRTGFAAFERRAGREDAFGRSWTALLEAATASLPPGMPAIFTLGERTPLPTPDLRLSGTENGAACVFWIYGQKQLPQITDGLRDVDLIQRLAEYFECVGDYMCGYGRTGRIFREHGKRFVMSDHNTRCIGYVAEHAGEWRADGHIKPNRRSEERATVTTSMNGSAQAALMPVEAYWGDVEDDTLRRLLQSHLDEALPLAERVATLNRIREIVAEFSPFTSEPVDCVQWVAQEDVEGNLYNPNKVAPPEMELLRLSIMADGYTQPIVTNAEEDRRVVIDGFHRHRVGRECEDVRERVQGFLPVVQIRGERTELPDRMASTIRHNRARGKHGVEAMSDIVVELKRRNWSNAKIGRELGMDADEVLRLCQITGLAELFADREFSRAWEPVGSIAESDFEDLTDDVDTYGDDFEGVRTVNTSDPDRIFHPHETWECHKAGFYAGQKTGVTRAQGEEMYRAFLSDLDRFGEALTAVTTEWKHSCEHYLTNVAMNRIAWLGQAAMCYATGIPASYRSGFGLLSIDEQTAANELALNYLNHWLEANGRESVDMETAMSNDRQSDIY